jgi:hypothetical protein
LATIDQSKIDAKRDTMEKAKNNIIKRVGLLGNIVAVIPASALFDLDEGDALLMSVLTDVAGQAQTTDVSSILIRQMQQSVQDFLKTVLI